MKKKIKFHQTFPSMQNLLELQCLVNDSVDFLELASKVPFISFLFLRNRCGWFKITTCSYTCSE